MFHKHFFKESNNPEVLYCYCGAIKNIHQHIWVNDSDILNIREKTIGTVLKCSKCGDLKNHYINKI